KNANSLSKNTQDAIHAIQTKNEDKLNDVLKETQHLRQEIEKLKESIYKDELTNAYNRKWLHDNYLHADGDNFINAGLLAIIDLNYFKQVNDTHGHVIGDKVLIYITNELKKLKHPVIRYGGDEFIIIFDEKPKRAQLLLNKLRDTVITKKLKAHESTFTASFSFGIAPYKKGERLNQVIERADKDMYQDKIEIKKRIKGI
ncbi:GGDEF domain-containing protein, partial [Sulfurimonas sp.]